MVSEGWKKSAYPNRYAIALSFDRSQCRQSWDRAGADPTAPVNTPDAIRKSPTSTQLRSQYERAKLPADDTLCDNGCSLRQAVLHDSRYGRFGRRATQVERMRGLPRGLVYRRKNFMESASKTNWPMHPRHRQTRNAVLSDYFVGSRSGDAMQALLDARRS